MATQTRKRKSEAMVDPDADNTNQNITTPTRSPAKKKLRITQAQKQALIDNLQLEITERARHLRAHYALQATDLRSRIERRINRIPIGLRKATMGELLEKHAAPMVQSAVEEPTTAIPSTTTITRNEHPLPPIPQEKSSVVSGPMRPVSRTNKRSSDDMMVGASDKENAQPPPMDALPNPKNPRRAKPTTTAPRTTSRSVKQGQTSVLSPKSHNSRNLPRSPIKEIPTTSSPVKTHSYLGRPPSPMKSASPLRSAASAATSAISASLAGMVEQAKRGTATVAKGRATSKEKAAAKKAAVAGNMAPPPRPVLDRAISQASNQSSTSSSSNSTTTTTVVTKKTTRPGKTTVTATSTSTRKTPTVPTVPTVPKAPTSAIATKPAAKKKVVVAEPAAGKRVLRKRN